MISDAQNFSHGQKSSKEAGEYADKWVFFAGDSTMRQISGDFMSWFDQPTIGRHFP